jgi:hypothetical protein
VEAVVFVIHILEVLLMDNVIYNILPCIQIIIFPIGINPISQCTFLIYVLSILVHVGIIPCYVPTTPAYDVLIPSRVLTTAAHVMMIPSRVLSTHMLVVVEPILAGLARLLWYGI